MFPTTDGKGLKGILQHLDELCVTTVERKCWKIARWIVPNFTRMTNSFMIFVFMIFSLYVCMYACMYHIHIYIYRCDSGHVSYIFIAPSALLSSISGSVSYIFFFYFFLVSTASSAVSHTYSSPPARSSAAAPLPVSSHTSTTAPAVSHTCSPPPPLARSSSGASICTFALVKRLSISGCVSSISLYSKIKNRVELSVEERERAGWNRGGAWGRGYRDR